jgi:hypothetical protein
MTTYKLDRTLICRNVRISSKLAHNAKGDWLSHDPLDIQSYTKHREYQAFRREASIWNVAAIIAKGDDNMKALKAAPKASREAYLLEARRRITRLQKWCERHPKEAEKLCIPLFAEYKAREIAREERKAVNA